MNHSSNCLPLKCCWLWRRWLVMLIELKKSSSSSLCRFAKWWLPNCYLTLLCWWLRNCSEALPPWAVRRCCKQFHLGATDTVATEGHKCPLKGTFSKWNVQCAKVNFDIRAYYDAWWKRADVPIWITKLVELPAESIPTTREITRPLLGHLPGVTCVPFGKIDVLTLAPWISTPSVNVNEHFLGYSSAVPLLRVILARNHNEAAGSESLIVRHSPPHFVIVSFHLTAAPPMLCVSLTDIMAESSVE